MSRIVVVPESELEELVSRVVTQALSAFKLPPSLPAAPHDSTLLTAAALCKELGISRTTLHSWVRDGKIPCTQIGRRIYFTREAILDHKQKGGKGWK